MDMPPSRYKVVEKGRRLIVVDRLTGEQVRHQIHETPHRPDMPAIEARRMEAPRSGPAPRAQLAGPGRAFTTAAWYDDKAPRTLQLSDDALSTLFVAGGVLLVAGTVAFFFLGFIALFVLGFFALQKGTRTALRRGATAWLDSLSPA